MIYSCNHLLGVYRRESLWVLTRQALARGSDAWTEMRNKVVPIIKSLTISSETKKQYWDAPETPEAGVTPPESYWKENNFLIASAQGNQFCDYPQ